MSRNYIKIQQGLLDELEQLKQPVAGRWEVVDYYDNKQRLNKQKRDIKEFLQKLKNMPAADVVHMPKIDKMISIHFKMSSAHVRMQKEYKAPVRPDYWHDSERCGLRVDDESLKKAFDEMEQYNKNENKRYRGILSKVLASESEITDNFFDSHTPD